MKNKYMKKMYDQYMSTKAPDILTHQGNELKLL